MASTISLEAIENFLKLNPNEQLQAFADIMKQSGKSMADMGEISSRVGPQITTALQNAQQAAQGFGNIISGVLENGTELWNQLNDSVNNFVKAQENAGEDIGTIAVAAAGFLDSFLGIIPDSITGMGKFGEAGKIAGNTIHESFKDIEPLLRAIPGIGKGAAEGFGRMANQADGAYQLQRGLISLAASQGQLSSLVDYGTNSFQNIDQAMTQMSDSTFESAVATGQSVSAMMNLAEILGKIPGALTDNINMFGRHSSQLVVASQIATAFGQSQTEIAKTLNTMYDQMGLHGTESMRVISRMYESAGDSKLRFEGFSKSVMDIATSFKMLGDNTNSATTVVKAFDTAFKDSTISPAAMQQVISHMAAGIENMDRGKQAFISSATGGPGGLAGSFQMELAMQEGRMDEVLSKTMTAMQQQFGGQTLTLKDAAENPALAGEFYKQVQYLTQVAGVAKDDREAYRMLEAMKNGVIDMLKPTGTEDGSKALFNATERGISEQKRTTSAIISLHQMFERTKLFEAAQTGKLNTTINEETGLDYRLTDSIGMSGSKGIQAMGTTLAFKNSIIPRNDLDIRTDVANDFKDIGSSLISGIKNFRQKTKEESDLEEAQVGAGINIPGVVREPAGPALITKASGNTINKKSALDIYNETGTFPALPVTVEHSPIQVKVELGEPFNKAVTTIVRQEIQNSNAAQNIRANGGT